MKATSITILTFLLFLNFSYGQNQANIWYFGDGAGLDFNNGDPVSINGGQTYLFDSHNEGCSVISDSTGHMLFYSNGEKVWNSNHDVMPDGEGLMGNFSSTQAALIIPQPGSSRFYYLFTTDSFYAANDLRKGFRYSIIDMCLDDGLGDVIESSKNTLLLDMVSEKLTAVRHSNGVDYWVLVHKYFSDDFYAYKLTDTGITDIVISEVGVFHDGNLPGSLSASIGQMKASPDGTKLALCVGNRNPSYTELYDFDANTGNVSNAINLPADGSEYGVSFSPDNSKLYFSTFGNGDIYQYDLSVGEGDPEEIIASKQIVAALEPGSAVVGLQLGPDGKIYASRFQESFIAVINSPNESGILCDYVDNAIGLNGNFCNYTFPGFVDNFDYSNTVTDCTTQINTFESSDDLRIYPNPTTDRIYIETKDAVSVELLNINGSPIFNGTKKEIDVSSYKEGIYFIKVTNNSFTITKKIIIQ